MNSHSRREPPTSFDLSGFAWAVGIEDTAIGVPIRDGGRTLDEYELTGHYDQWRRDLDRVAELGCTALRYGLPWYRLNPAPGVWDWSWLDEVVDYAANTAGIGLIADLVHYGTPAWLTGAFTDARYPDAIAAHAAQVAERYGPAIPAYTPLNEPLVTASFCGERAVWPPYATGDGGWAEVTVALARGIQATVAALRSARPDTTVVHVEATHVWTTSDDSLRPELALRNLRNYLPTDLVTGQVTADHPLYPWLLGHGVAASTLERLAADAVLPDAIGLNYYPNLSCRELVRYDGQVVSVAVDGGEAGLRQVLGEFHDRYRLPVLVAETGVDGKPGEHVEWLQRAVRTVFEERAAGRPVAGFTWWPLFDFVDWGWASAGRVVEEFYVRDADGPEAGRVRPVFPPGRDDDVASYLRRMGLYRLEVTDGLLARTATEAIDAFRSITAQPVPPVGGGRLPDYAATADEREAS